MVGHHEHLPVRETKTASVAMAVPKGHQGTIKLHSVSLPRVLVAPAQLVACTHACSLAHTREQITHGPPAGARARDRVTRITRRHGCQDRDHCSGLRQGRRRGLPHQVRVGPTPPSMCCASKHFVCTLFTGVQTLRPSSAEHVWPWRAAARIMPSYCCCEVTMQAGHGACGRPAPWSCPITATTSNRPLAAPSRSLALPRHCVSLGRSLRPAPRCGRAVSGVSIFNLSRPRVVSPWCRRAVSGVSIDNFSSFPDEAEVPPPRPPRPPDPPPPRVG